MIPETERAWAAGFFEGEGSVRIFAQPSSRSLGVLSAEVTQVDREPMDWIAARWPGTLHFIQPRTPRCRPFYRWVRLSYNALAFLADIRPFLVRSEVIAKIDLAIAFQGQKVRTHANRTPEYRAAQKSFIAQMRLLNFRGSEVERAALASRV